MQRQSLRQVAVGSGNPVKGEAVLRGFRSAFPSHQFKLISLPVAAEVLRQPLSDEETLRGARRRAKNAAWLEPAADYWVGIEGGVEDTPAGMAAFAWVVTLSHKSEGLGKSATFFLPSPVARLVRSGKELGEANDLTFGTFNSKQKGGATGLLTGGALDRVSLYEQAVVVSLLPFMNPDLYSEEYAKR